MGARMIDQSNNGREEKSPDENGNTGVGIEAHEMIDELTKRLTQLTFEGIVKDVVIRKLEAQIQSSQDQEQVEL